MSTRTHEVPAGVAHGGVGTAVEPPPARRRGLGTVLVVLGAALAALLVAGTALALVALVAGTARQEATERASYEGVEAVGVDASCAGDASVVADPAMAPGTAEVVWRERWALQPPSHAGAVRGGSLDVGTTCSRVTVGISALSDVSVRTAPGVGVVVGSGAGDVVVVGTDAGVEVSTGTGDVRVEGAAGTVAVDTDAGDVTVDGSLVRARVDTGAGDVGVTSSAPPDLVDVGTGVGDVVVRLPAGDASYAVVTDTGLGETRVGVPEDAGAARRVLVDAGVGDVTVEGAP